MKAGRSRRALRRKTARLRTVRYRVSLRISRVLLFAASALCALGCASSPGPAPVAVERIYYLPAPVSPPDPCPPGAHHQKPKQRHRHGPPRTVVGASEPLPHGPSARAPASRGRGPLAARPPRDHGPGPHAGAPRKPPTRVKLPHDRRRPEKPGRSLRADVPEPCAGACREQVKRRERDCRRSFDRSRVEACIDELEREMRRAGGAHRRKG